MTTQAHGVGALVAFAESRKCGRCKGAGWQLMYTNFTTERTQQTCGRCGGTGKDPDAQRALSAWRERRPLRENGDLVTTLDDYVTTYERGGNGAARILDAVDTWLGSPGGNNRE